MRHFAILLVGVLGTSCASNRPGNDPSTIELAPSLPPRASYETTEGPRQQTGIPFYSVSAQQSKTLVGPSSALFAEGGHWWNLAAYNPDLFNLHVAGDGSVALSPKSAGTFRVILHSSILGIGGGGKVVVRLFKLAGNEVLAYAVYDVDSGESEQVFLERVVALNADDRVVAHFQQFTANGQARVWIGTSNSQRPTQYSGFTIEKL